MKKALLLFAALLTMTVIDAQQVSEQEALTRAQQFFGKASQSLVGKGKVPRQAPVLTLANNRDEFYVFNNEANGGYVVISGEERMPDVLGYSYNGHFDADDIPCNLRALLEGYSDQVKYLKEHQEARLAPHQEVIDDYVSPLLESHWDQNDPYNRKCPKIRGNRTVTGCVATAMAQLMYYYQWPKQTTRPIPAYTTYTSKLKVSEKPITDIDWENMLPDYINGHFSDEEANAVATLMLLCGASIQMDYNLDWSAGGVDGGDFEKYFDYYGGQSAIRSGFDYSVWCQMLYEELKEGHPVLYRGVSPESIGHMFVIDGYDVNYDGEDPEAYFHVNLGWGGYADAFYSLNNVQGYNSGQSAIVGLRPNDYAEAELPYAVLDNGKLTLYCDSKIETRLGRVFQIGCSELRPQKGYIYERQWNELGSEILECEIDSSFSKYKMIDGSRLFADCSKLESIKGLAYLNTKYLNSTQRMFAGCSSLVSLDLSGFNTESVANMEGMFYGCSSLASLDLSGFNTENVTDMCHMFSDCSSLTSLNLISFKTDKVTYIYGMFSGCSSLTSLDLSGFNTKNVEILNSMFDGCSSLTSLDVSSFNTSKVNDMNRLFYNCSSLKELDLSNFSTEKVTMMYGMFYYNSELETIYVGDGWSTANVESTWSERLFYGCKKLVGGMGTEYSWDHTGIDYAHIDEGPNNPGYFTYKDPTDIKIVQAAQGIEQIYAPSGKKLDKLQKGLNIVVMKDGTVRKVLIK